MNTMETNLLTAAQLGAKLGRCAWTILEWRKQGKIPAEVGGKPILFDEARVREALRKEVETSTR